MSGAYFGFGATTATPSATGTIDGPEPLPLEVVTATPSETGTTCGPEAAAAPFAEAIGRVSAGPL